MSNKKKILFVMNTMGRAGAEHALVELIRQLDSRKFDISLYVLIPRGEMFKKIPEYVTVLNKKVDSRSVLSSGGKLFILRKLARCAFTSGCLKKTFIRFFLMGKKSEKTREVLLRRMLADGTPALGGEYDLAVAYLEGPATWFTAEKVCAARKAAFLHIDYEKAGYTKELDQDCYAKYNHIFAVSQDVKEKFLSFYPEYSGCTSLFFNIIDKEGIRRQARLPGGFSDGYKGVRILTVGRLYYQKGYDTAVRTASCLRDKGYEFRWYVLGEGEERKNIQNLIRKMGLEGRFILLGAADNPYPYFAQTDIYVCTSRFEGKSIVIEEAQTLGKTVVSLACTGITEQISSGKDGIVVDGGTAVLAETIGKLIDNPEKRKHLGQAAYKKDYFDYDGMKQFLNMLQE